MTAYQDESKKILLNFDDFFENDIEKSRMI